MSGTPGRLNWGVKESFIAYVRKLDDGSIEAINGATREGDVFGFDGVSADDSGLLFAGGVHFTGFAGMLDVRLTDLMIEAGATAPVLSALVGPPSIAARTVIATFDGASAPVSGSAWGATPRLTFEGVRVFGDVYQVGTELSVLSVEPGQS